MSNYKDPFQIEIGGFGNGTVGILYVAVYP